MIGRNAAQPSTRWVIVLLIAFAVSFAACGDDDPSPTEAAQTDACDARDDLRTAVTDVADDVRAGDLDAAKDSLPDVATSIDQLSTAIGELTEAERAKVQPQIDAIKSTLGAVTVSDLDELGPTVDTITDDVDQALDEMGDGDALDCP